MHNSIFKNNSDTVRPQPYVRNPALGFAILFGGFFIMLSLVSFISELILNRTEATTPILRISTILQDLLVFIAPALLTAIAVTRLPATFLHLDIKPKLRTSLLACLVLITSIPAMEWIISLNESITFPDSMSGIESALREMENNAAGAISLLQGGGSVIDLIMSILIIGCLTGLCEELFFRGALQGLLFSTKMKKHLAVWITAAIFSLLHLQFFGFFPRMLLGAYFGYLLWWSGSIWIPILVHALNNSIAVAESWINTSVSDGHEIESTADNIMTPDTATIILSVVVTVLGIILLRRHCARLH